MKLPVFWLKKYIPVEMTAEKLAEAFTLSGTAVERVETHAGEPVLDIEVTTNRPDCLSILGLARELSALTGKKMTPFPAPKERAFPKAAAGPFQIKIEDKKGCPQYTARLIRNVTVRSAPVDAQKCLDAAGSRPVSNVVDATNFVLFETGQPLHAFDFDKLKGGVILVRRARANEKFTGIDGVEYTLDDKTLVIADAERAVAIAGVMGGQATEVTSSTKNILLESAYFDPALVRQAARRHKIGTESSYRFERGVNPDGVKTASGRARDLILEWAGGEEIFYAEKSSAAKSGGKKIVLRASRVETLLGFKIPLPRMKKILNLLGLEAELSGKDALAFTRTARRRDLQQEADLIEEVLRIEGFAEVPTSLPLTRHPLDSPEDKKAALVPELKKFLAAEGFQEIVTYSLLSKKTLDDSMLLSGAERIANAASTEQEFFRPSLLPGMLGAVTFNVNRKAPFLKLFEIGNVFADGREETRLSLALYGATQRDWRHQASASYYDLKGAVENIADYLRRPVSWREEPGAEWSDNGAAILASEKSVGRAGALNGEILRRWDLAHPVYFAELRLGAWLDSPAQPVRLRAVPKFPSVKRDVAFIVDDAVPVARLEAAMFLAAAPYLQEAQLFDEFTGKNIPGGKRSLAFSLAYSKESGTFTDDEIQALQAKVGQTLKDEFRVEFR